MQNYNSKLKIIFFGSSSYVIPIIKVLKENFDLKLVVTTDRSQGAVPSFCTQNKIKFITIKQFSNSAIQQLKEIKSPVAILADFGLIIPPEILNLFPQGIINIHPSLLPKYRGPTPVQTAILNGEKTTGVSIMKLDNEIDHGPILGQKKEEILETDTAESLYKRLFAKGANLLPKVLNLYLEERLNPTTQNNKDATFTKTLTRQSGFIDISKFEIRNSKFELKRMIRAYHPWPGVWTSVMMNDKELRIKFLPNQKLQVEGKKPVHYKDFANGYPNLKQFHSLLNQLIP